MNGYQHPQYADSFSEFGILIELNKSNGRLLKRLIPETPFYDAMGCYPLFACSDWKGLPSDILKLSDDLVSVSLVTDPFGNYTENELTQTFDCVLQSNDHFVFDYSKTIHESISKSRREQAKRALKDVVVDIQVSPNIDVEEWSNLYSRVIDKYQIKGLRKFSLDSFKKQLTIPNTFYFRALNEGKIIGGDIYFLQGEIAYAHLSALESLGYELKAGYALKWIAINHFQNIVDWITFGGTTSISGVKNEGLIYFKKGWSNCTRKTYFCGKILNQDRYDEITSLKGFQGSTWFPSYRDGEFS